MAVVEIPSLGFSEPGPAVAVSAYRDGYVHVHLDGTTADLDAASADALIDALSDARALAAQAIR
jgi:hypothetical protein